MACRLRIAPGSQVNNVPSVMLQTEPARNVAPATMPPFRIIMSGPWKFSLLPEFSGENRP